MKRTKKYLVRALGALVGLLVIFWMGMYIFFLVRKENIRQELSQEIGNSIAGQFLVRDIGINFFNLFPNVSISLKGVDMRDSAWQVHHESFLKAEKILLRINPFFLLGGKIRISKLVIENAVIRDFSNASGYTNEYLLSPKSRKPKDQKRGFHLEEIALKNIRIIRSDELKNKLYDLSFRKLKCELYKKEEDYNLEIKMDGFIHSLAFNLDKGSYAREKSINGNFVVHFATGKKELSFENIHLAIDRHPYLFSGLFAFNEQKDFRLAISTKKVVYAKALSLLPEKISKKLSEYNIDKPFDVKVIINGKMQHRNLPRVSVDTKIQKSLVTTPVGNFSDLSFSGNFSNAVKDTLPFTDENSALTVTELKGSWENIPISSKKMIISNLINPFLQCDIKAETNLASMNDLLNSASFEFVGGQVKAEVSYAGALMSDTTTSLDGVLHISNGTINYRPRRVKLEKINGALVFQNSDVYIKDLNAEAQNNKVKINAVVRNMLNLLTKDPSKLYVDAEITSPSLDLYAFKTMLGSRKRKARVAKGRFSRLADKIDHFMDACSISSRLHAGRLKYGNFNASDVEAAFSMNADKWNLHKISLKHSDGWINLSGTLTSMRDNDNDVVVETELSNVNVAKLFAAFGNFGLQSLHAENLKGSLSSKMHLKAVLDDESKLVPSSLSGSVELSLRNGELINFDPLQKMAVFVLKKRDFSQVDFAEIKNTFMLDGSSITINRMEVQSNVLGLYVEGIYDLHGKNTDLVVQVPLKYLKKREPGYVPENQGITAKTGISVFVRARSGDNGDIDFKYGLFKKRSILEKADREKEREMKKATTRL